MGQLKNYLGPWSAHSKPNEIPNWKLLQALSKVILVYNFWCIIDVTSHNEGKEKMIRVKVYSKEEWSHEAQ